MHSSFALQYHPSQTRQDLGTTSSCNWQSRPMPLVMLRVLRVGTFLMATRLWATVCMCIVVLVTAEPIKKRVNWFVSPGIRAEQSKFLLGSRICDGVYTCCGGASFLPNGTGHEFLYFAFFISKFSTTPKLVRRQTCLWTNFVQIKSLNWYKHSRSATPGAQHNSAAAISRGRSACNVHLGRRCVAAGRMGKKERDCRANIKLGSEI